MNPLVRRLAFTSLLGVGAFAAPAVFGCGACAPAESADPATVATADHRATLQIEGMTCASCSVTVKTTARKLDGLVSIDVDVPAGRATVTFDSAKVTAAAIAAKITDAGYATTVETDGEV